MALFAAPGGEGELAAVRGKGMTEHMLISHGTGVRIQHAAATDDAPRTSASPTSCVRGTVARADCHSFGTPTFCIAIPTTPTWTARVLKQNRANGGIGVWKVSLAEPPAGAAGEPTPAPELEERLPRSLLGPDAWRCCRNPSRDA
jgi:hypothetical protein